MRLNWFCLVLGAVSLFAQAPLTSQGDRAVESSQPWLNGGILTLTREVFGPYPRCDLTVRYHNPPEATDGVALRCTRGIQNEFVASRKLSAEEVAAVTKLVLASDLYSGGHVGSFRGMHGPFERLEVLRCCGRVDTVVLITSHNPTFSLGARQALLTLLNEWRVPLMAQVRNQK
jgi:hypothetical protein